ncbi:efflux transporter periplasmic adaptor subunit [Roseicella frigidaeris]|uniref:Efflux transporter periplasmic adaptor subunit n=2 Tax=Roseicella frigidaeris TaxID=2230885 RepID=A0A327M5C0_9PROT|nr:efflux transporter periplasmic adaptor subunit [Roseicella frigidaeris]
MRRGILLAALVPAAALGLGGYAAHRAGWTDPFSRSALASEHQGHDHNGAGGGGNGASGHPTAVVPAGDHSAHQAHPAEERPATTSPRRILYYRNPMGLPDTSPVPKKDSMGMDYVPVYEGEAADDGMVRVAPGRLQTSGVRTEPVARRQVVRPVRAPGSIQLDERRVSVVALRTEAFVERVEPVTTGDRVRKGQPLMRVFSADVVAAGAQYVAMLNTPSGATSATPEGARRRLENLGVPPEVLAEIDRNRRIPQSLVWPAPRDGVVLERTAVDGMRAPPGEALFRLADLSVVWVLAEIPERDVGSVAPGQTVEVRPRGLPDRAFQGRVALIYPQLNASARTARVRIELPNPDGLLLPGMYAEVEIAASGGGATVAVPEGAVIDSGTRRVVFLERGEGRYEPREVRIGRRGGGFVEVREGLAEGDRVVVAANFLIDAESNLRAALRGLAAATPAGEDHQ